MKKTLLIVIWASLSATPAFAADHVHQPPAAVPLQPGSARADAGDVQAGIPRMHEQMERIRRTTDLQERQKLMREHMHAVQQIMQTMGGMDRARTAGVMGGQRPGVPPPLKGDSAGGMDAAPNADQMPPDEMIARCADMMRLMMGHEHPRR